MLVRTLINYFDTERQTKIPNNVILEVSNNRAKVLIENKVAEEYKLTVTQDKEQKQPEECKAIASKSKAKSKSVEKKPLDDLQEIESPKKEESKEEEITEAEKAEDGCSEPSKK